MGKSKTEEENAGDARGPEDHSQIGERIALAKQQQHHGDHRFTIVEADEEDEEDSFEIKREELKKKELEGFLTKLEQKQ